MYYLIKKDILMQKKAVKLSILIMIFFTFFLFKIGSAGLSIGVLAISYQLALGASSLEEKNHSDKILISLPIKKSTIVLAKYLSVYVYALYATIVYSLIYFVVNQLSAQPELSISFQALEGVVIIVTMFASLSFPFIFKYGFIKSRIPNFIIFFTFLFGGTKLYEYLSDKGQLVSMFNQLSSAGISTLMIGVVLLMFVCSYFLSLNFYKKREF
ncbi:ABC-2 transporter permease [Bacillus changyiensis]|uniref:ABC-2 transporter permease n=1 Tax=Bacillus changyiensis TaxID=3004103 RepID=UPI0022E7C7E3|nr:ABC-2 transporter permease [Bacillus changyiensis]MDA1475163.1 ABC-2 transporter permease [Bacillus changyiensis]